MQVLVLLLLTAVSPSAAPPASVVLTDELMIGTWECGPTTMHGPNFDLVVTSRATNRSDHTSTTVTTSVITPHGAAPITNIDEGTETWTIDRDLITRTVSKIRFVSSTDPKITLAIGQQIVNDQIARKSVYQSRVLGIDGRVIRSIPFNATQKQTEVESICRRLAIPQLASPAVASPAVASPAVAPPAAAPPAVAPPAVAPAAVAPPAVAPPAVAPKRVIAIESTKSLGNGFFRVVQAEEVHDGLESVGHFSYCYYRKLNLGRCDRMFVSPSGKSAIYQEAASGLVMYFDSKSRRSIKIPSEVQGLLENATWDEKTRSVSYVLDRQDSTPIRYQY